MHLEKLLPYRLATNLFLRKDMLIGRYRSISGLISAYLDG
jgi:hypothetical protein